MYYLRVLPEVIFGHHSTVRDYQLSDAGVRIRVPVLRETRKFSHLEY